jgi:hypothetical protein
MFDLFWYVVIGFIVGYLISRASIALSNYTNEKQVRNLKEALDNMVFVTVETHTVADKTIFLMFTLVDDKFILQATTPIELMERAKEKFPNKVIMMHGDETVAKIPEFIELQK